MRTYEALIIFAETVNEENVKQAMDAFVAEIERQGGTEEDRIVLGRRMFARPLKKRDSGVYGKVYFKLEPDKMLLLKQRCKHIDVLFRIQIALLPKGYQHPGERSAGEAVDKTAVAEVSEPTDADYHA